MCFFFNLLFPALSLFPASFLGLVDLAFPFHAGSFIYFFLLSCCICKSEVLLPLRSRGLGRVTSSVHDSLGTFLSCLGEGGGARGPGSLCFCRCVHTLTGHGDWQGRYGMLRLTLSWHLGEYLQVFSPKPVFPNKCVPPSYWGKDAWLWAFWEQ